MSVERNRAALLRFYEAISRQDLDAMAGCLADGYRYHGPADAGTGQDREAFLEFERAAFQAFPDFRVDVLDTVAERDLVAARLRVAGTHRGEFLGIPASGRALDLEYGNLSRFDSDGRIVEDRDYIDTLELMQQLGVNPDAAPG